MAMNIDEIFNLLDWNNSETLQQKGREAARKIQNFYILIQPGYNKPIWDNCALVISEKSDDELDPHIYRLLEWIKDLNWPGAGIILDRLKEMDTGVLIGWFHCCARDALTLKDEPWLRNLIELCKNKELRQKIDPALYQEIVCFLEEMDKDE